MSGQWLSQGLHSLLRLSGDSLGTEGGVRNTILRSRILPPNMGSEVVVLDGPVNLWGPLRNYSMLKRSVVLRSSQRGNSASPDTQVLVPTIWHTSRTRPHTQKLLRYISLPTGKGTGQLCQSMVHRMWSESPKMLLNIQILGCHLQGQSQSVEPQRYQGLWIRQLGRC